MFSNLKGLPRSAASRTIDGLIDAMGDALRAVTARDIPGWFRHRGYCY